MQEHSLAASDDKMLFRFFAVTIELDHEGVGFVS